MEEGIGLDLSQFAAAASDSTAKPEPVTSANGGGLA
jgi:hypothetical protein